MTTLFRPLGAPALLVLVGTLPLAAQSTPPAVASAAEAIVALSPFEVSASQDTGYVVQNTLAGSRVRTNLKNIAAAISPMTEEFLQDIAATNIVEAMEYRMNSRVETDDGRAAGPVADNVLDEDAFIVNNTHPRTGAPTTYRDQDPRKWTLTNSFTF
jgi:hypothetical protein